MATRYCLGSMDTIIHGGVEMKSDRDRISYKITTFFLAILIHVIFLLIAFVLAISDRIKHAFNKLRGKK